MSALPLPAPASRPRHVAIIMDGNGRWAKERGLPRLEGHRRGANIVRDITTFARELGIEYLTLYSFSVQNWARPPEEVRGLMQLLEDYCRKERDTLMKNGVRLNTIGELGRLPAATREAVAWLKRETAQNSGMTLTLALDYGGREEIARAVQHLARDARDGRLDPESIDETTLAARLDTASLPDPDLVVRTSGEQRVSNFLLWQLAYAELYFTEVRWPDFNREHFVRALSAFAMRERRFGGVDPAPRVEVARGSGNGAASPGFEYALAPALADKEPC